MRRALPLPAVLLLGYAACTDRDLGPVVPQVQQGTKLQLIQPGEQPVDLLVLVDNSSSMREEQENLGRNFGILIDRLTNPTDGREPVLDLHVGIISTDMGVGGYSITTCDKDPNVGDDGTLQHLPSAEVAGCDDSYPSFLAYHAVDGAPDGVYTAPAALNQAFQCIAQLGTSGCGFEQQLKATLKALTVHAEGANAGFLRPDSLLAILLVTDEEDCSLSDDIPDAARLFGDPSFGDENLRCFRHGAEFLTPVETFTRQLLALRAGEPERIVMAGIVGIPVDTGCNLVNMSGSDFDCLLDHPGMQEVIDPTGLALVPSCNEPGLGKAYPPRRIVQLIQQINEEGDNGIVQSICQSDFGPAMEAISSLIQEKFGDACLARPLLPDATTGQVPCRVVETLSDDEPCGPGRVTLGSEGGHRQCQVCQQGDGAPTRLVDELGTDLSACAAASDAGDVWRYVPSTARCTSGTILFEGRTIAAPGSHVRLECLSQVSDFDDLGGSDGFGG